MNINFPCTLFWIFQDLPHQLWEAQSADGAGANILLTRLFHNKPLYFAGNIARCYTSYFSPEFIAKTFTVIGVVLFILGIYKIISKRRWWLLLILVVAPLFPLLRLPSREFFQGLILYVVEGLVILSVFI